MSNGTVEGNRWTYVQRFDGVVSNVSQLMMVGYDQNRKAVPLVEHVHEGCYEFVYIQSGKVRWRIEDKVYDTWSGDVFHTKPNERHSGYMDIIEPSEIWWVIIQEPSKPGWMGLSDKEIGYLAQHLVELPRIVPAGKLPIVPLTRLRTALIGADALRSLQIRTCLLDIVLMILHKYEDHSPANELREAIARIVGKAETEPAWRPTVEELAQMANVSESHFYRMFHAVMGLSPMAYLERNRMEIACARLRQSNIAITELALDLGMQTSQHFATVFKRHTGTTPTAWRQRNS